MTKIAERPREDGFIEERACSSWIAIFSVDQVMGRPEHSTLESQLETVNMAFGVAN